MCGQCRGVASTRVDWFNTGHGVSLRERREARSALAQVLTRLGGAQHLIVTAPPGLLAWQLRLPTGKAETAGSFSELLDLFMAAWDEPLDPLNAKVLEQMSCGYK